MARIERRHLVLVRNLTLLSVAIAGAPIGWRALRDYLRQDAFAGLRKPSSNEPVGIRLEGVRFKHYSGNRLLTSASADRIDVSRDRYHMTMFGIRDGLYRDGDRAFRYRARNANWDASKRILTIDGGVRILNDKLNLRADGAKFESRKKRLIAGGDIRGALFNGQFVAQNLTFNTETEAFEVGPVSWKGKLAANWVQDAPEEVKQRVWNFKAKRTKSDGSKSNVVTHLEAIATDGEIIVIAPQIVHDRKTDEIVATGTEKERIQYFSAKANMVASRVHVFQKEKRAVFTGNVVMLVKPKSEQQEKPKVEALPAFQPLVPDQVKAERPVPKRPKEEVKKDEQIRETKNIRDYPLVMTSAKVEYWYGRGARRAVITGDPQGRQELSEGRWRHLWTNVGYYDGEKEELRLVSTQGRKDTRMKNSIGDDAVADWMLLSTKEDDDAFEGSGIEGDFADLSGEDDPRNNSRPANPPKTPPTTGGGTGTPPPASDRRPA